MKMPRFVALTKALQVGVIAAGIVGSPARAGTSLAPLELEWLKGAWPVIEHAKAAGMPVDIVVQPQPAQGEPPMALAYVGGRCKLVLTMRDNKEAQASLDRMDAAFKAAAVDTDEARIAAIQLVAAHEVYGHCARHVTGAWQQVPVGYAMSPPAQLDEGLRQAWVQMRTTRLEEGFADLAGLAWARRHWPRLYPALHAWLLDERARDLIPGSHHDTLIWIQAVAPAPSRAGDGGVGPAAPARDDEWAVDALWQSVLSKDR